MERSPRWVTALNGALDGTLVAFGLWTLMYEVALVADLRALPLVVAWLPLAVAAVALCVWRAVRWDADPADAVHAGARPGWVRRTAGPAALVGAVLVALVALVALPALLSVLLVVAVLTTVAALAAGVFGDRPAVAVRMLGTRTHVAAGLMVLALTVFSMFVLNPASDDIYYVNLSVWVADHGTFPLRDTMFGPQTFPATYGGGVPVASVEGLFGALAGLLHVHAATLVYLVAAPVCCALAGWAVWRLVVLWAPRRALLALAAALVYPLLHDSSGIGHFSYTRMWEGKVIALCVVLPLAWVYFTELTDAATRRQRWWPLTMLTVAGLAFAGLTPTAVILAPLASAAAAVAAVLVRRNTLPSVAGAALFSVSPLVAGVAVLLFSTDVGGAEPTVARTWRVFARALGYDRPVLSVTLLALLLGPLLVRRVSGRALAGAATLCSLLVLAPGVLTLLNHVTGSGPIAYRLLLLAPAPVLVGLLLTVPMPDRLPARARTGGAALLALAMAAVLVLGGTPAIGPGHGRLTSTPTWKVSQPKLETVRAVLRLHPGDGPVLLPQAYMRVLPIVTTKTFVVVPREFYLSGLAEPGDQHLQRKVLNRLANREKFPVPSAPAVDQALAELDVSMACFRRHSKAYALVRSSGYTNPREAGKLVCLSAPRGY